MHEGNEKDELIESGLLILSGGRDVSGNFLLTIPTSKLDDLTEWEGEKLTTLCLHMAEMARCLKMGKNPPVSTVHTLPLALLVDLRVASKAVITLIVESLESVEHHSRGTISVAYFISPKKTSKSHTLKKLLGIKPSKKRPRAPLFKSVIVKTIQELHTHIDISHLTLDFCGTLLYNHLAWMHFYNVVIKCIEGCQVLLTKLTSVKDRVDLLQEYETEGQTSSQLQQLLAELMDKFHIIITESFLPFCLVQCKQTIFLLEHPSSDSHISAVHSDLIEGFRTCLRELFTKLDLWNTELEEAWRVTENRLTLLIQLHKHRERAKEIQRKIFEHYNPLLREHPIVGKTLSQAELYRAHFTTTLYEPAKELLSQATEILEAVHRLKNGTTVVGSGHYTTFSGLDISDISNLLTTSIQPFTQHLQHLQQIYVNIHIFHLLFEKTLIWYKKVLKFLPETLLDKCTVDSELSSLDLSFYNLPPQGNESLVYMPTEWLGAVRVFLSRHPPPRQEHIDKLDEAIPQLVDKKLRSQARSLALRLRLIQRLLSSTRLPLQLVKAVLAWRAELFGIPQGERTNGNYHTLASSKHRNKSSDNLDSIAGSQSDRLPSDSVQTFNRTPDKTGKRKSLGSLELETNLGKPNPLLAVTERNVDKKTPLRSMFRAKSVEFNFNSSSTDGSVFDYERAVSGIQQQAAGQPPGKDMIRARAYPRKARRESQDTVLRATNMERRAFEDVAFSDPSDLLQSRDLENRLDSALKKEYKTDGSADDFSFQGKSYSVLEPSSSLTPESQVNPENQTPPNQTKSSNYGNKPSPLDIGHSAPDERFIRLTFTPKERKSHPLYTFKFESLESDKEKPEQKVYADDEEYRLSPTEESQDPYDNLVQKIRDISASELSNTEKLKRVSKLLSASSTPQNPEEDGTEKEEKKSLGRFSKSALDLRQQESHQSEDEAFDKEPLNSFSENAKENPIDAVLRMKRNLAKSMEELTTIGLQTAPLPFHLANGRSEVRYKTEVKINPVFELQDDTKDDTLDQEDSYNFTEGPKLASGSYSTNSDVNTTRFSKPESQPKHQSWSDLDSISPVSSNASKGQKIRQSAATKDKTSPETETKLLDHFWPSYLDHGLPDYDIDYDPKLSSSRMSLNHLANRNFLSPSFLRPAVSMKDLTSRPVETFNRYRLDFDQESDYRDLEEIEMLRSIQEDSLSNEFSKLSSDKKKHSRVFTGDFMEKMKTEPSFSSGDYGNANAEIVGRASSSVKVKGSVKEKSVPDIHVDYIYFVEHMDSPGEDGQDVDLLYSNDHFNRLITEAEQEHLSQEEVASSLRKTERILEEEEIKRRHLERQLSDMSQEESSADGIQHGARSLSHTASTDNGYGSWPSKLVTVLSTSSEGPDLELDFFPKRGKSLDPQKDLY
ncbi:uncharacterized protein LOC106060929 [Biomphalaria glabrata]|uniref:Uncharacterized protein LOC106060929 n=1 Tax=Biomphalaria glabrata TaxID=6526 RepID=A0A9W3BNB1_BIOGL|nr:uncharacterized protein LOC106060929 [Biomphalaria glabrata]XP_055900961.1 uncharacterized protein LOC106060929 [Biomphalaria glabrata]XP_055900962.1 uncharacterized protein LOC106060929 [Biomphalaria glabrata]